MLYKSLTIGILFFQTSCFAQVPLPIDPDYEIENAQQSRGNHYLYITTPQQIEKMQTVTYLITKTPPNSILLDAFFYYSTEIGKSNGATIIKKADNLLVWFNKSNCSIKSMYPQDYLIFEDRVVKKCYYFLMSESEWIIPVLQELNSAIKGKSSFNSLETKIKLQRIAVEYLQKINSGKTTIAYALELIDALMKKYN